MNQQPWFQDSIIYQVFLDRFAGFTTTQHWQQPQFIGGTINGVIDKLPYLKELGITTLWISPFYKTSAYHGYHITDFFKVDPHFGTLKDLQSLITLAHKNKMHILADFVPNHCSNQHPFFKEAQEDSQSPYQEWFLFPDWPDEYQCFLRVKELPKFNLQHPPARQHIVDAAKYWLQQGFDGYRLDHVIGPTHDFWEYFVTNIKQEFPHVVLIGEAWMMGISWEELRTIHVKGKRWKWFRQSAASDSLLKAYVDQLDGVLDFRFQELIKQHIADNTYSKAMFNRLLKNHYNKFPDHYFLPSFLDNHDMDRFLFSCGNIKEKLKQAATIQFDQPQPPIIYYGTESGIPQQQSLWSQSSNGDIHARQPMNWDSLDTHLVGFYQQLIKKRQQKIG